MASIGSDGRPNRDRFWRDLGTRGLELGVGLRDALDEGAVFVQPYPRGHAPGSGREVWLRLRYDRG